MLRVARSISLRISESNSALTHCMPRRKGARRSYSRISISCSTGRCIPTSTTGRSGAHGRVLRWHSFKWAFVDLGRLTKIHQFVRHFFNLYVPLNIIIKY
ncbi:hypothetical protein KSP39_PZI017913 [Platanthera zijinensis]|uniref:Uncharacterized protein n=1 Tax=Platanthera zijinensis TaxID=2320716 RepID=A0AAP0B555_9ASPA